MLKLVKGLLEESSERALQIKIFQMILAEQYVTVPVKRVLVAHLFKIELLLP